MASQQSSTSRSRSVSTSQTRVDPTKLNLYNQSIQRQEQVYETMLSGYGEAQRAANEEKNRIYAGYGDIESKVMRMLGLDGSGGWGVAQAGANEISERSKQSLGEGMQGMINAGLGNTTAMQNYRDQNQLQTNRAFGELANKLADTGAGYLERIGLSRQQAMMQGLGITAGMANNYINALSGFKFTNTVGDLMRTDSRTVSDSFSQSAGASSDPFYGGGGSRGGSGGMANRPDTTMSNAYGYQQPYNPYAPTMQAVDYSQGRPPSFYSGSGGQVDLSGNYAPETQSRYVNYGPMTAASGQRTPLNPGVR